MDIAPIRQWPKAHRWWVALILVVVCGYSVGKDMAMGDNARDAAERTEGSGHA